ncbi:MAG: glycosyltransferase [Leptolyngbyaceae cyanobacterium SM1_3_5]|nr:glycosyltransferase [Leptolyngbyaceae cyanobacterium SM1_3_5]
MTLTNAHISLFIPNLDGGGAERITLNLAEGFAQRGLRVDLVLARAEGAYLNKVPSNVRLINLRARSPVFLFKTLALKRYLHQEQPDFILSGLDIVSAATWAKRLAGSSTQVIICVHTNLTQQFRDKPQFILGQLRAFLVRQFYPWADKILAVSQGVAESVAAIANLSVDEVGVIYNPVVTADFYDKSRRPVEHPWFQANQPPVILGVGRLVKQKDFATLIRAFAQVRRQRPVRLVILGDVDEREPTVKPQLEALIQELNVENDVLLPGFVDNPYAYMAKASLFVLSSIYEGLPTVLIEALAAGTSVVSTNCESGPVEILENGKYGKLVPIEDANALAEAINHALDHPLSSDLLQARADIFTMDKVIDQYLQVFEDLNHKRVA